MPQITTEIAQLPTSVGPNYAASISANGRWVASSILDENNKIRIVLQDTLSGAVKQVPFATDFGNIYLPKLSADGNMLGFLARLGSGTSQAYVLDLHNNQVRLASSDSNGTVANNTVSEFSLSGDGRYLTFSTYASNLVTGDINATSDVFLKDLSNGSIKLVSTNVPGNIANSASTGGEISRDGHYVLFRSDASNLGATNDGMAHLFLKDVYTDKLRNIDIDSNGNSTGISGGSFHALFSADAHKVVYETDKAIYVKDLDSGNSLNASTYANGKPLTGSSHLAAISADGRYLTLTSESNLGLNDTDSYSDAFQKDLQTGNLQLLTPHDKRISQTNGAYAIGASDDAQQVLIYSSNPTIFGDNTTSVITLDSRRLYLSNLNGVGNLNGTDALIGTTGADQLAGGNGNGNDSYWIDNVGDNIVETPTGGTDTVFSRVINYQLPANVENIQLNSTIGALRNAGAIGNDLANRITGNADDNILSGLSGDDIIKGGAGNDRIDGGAGFDIALYTYDVPVTNVVKIAQGYQATSSRNGFEGVDTLISIERIQGASTGIALPGDTNAAQAYRIYQAAFNRTPDQAGLGYWIKTIDNGAKLVDIAQGFIQSNEFKTLYGNNPGNASLVEHFYQNVLHRAPDPGGFNYWLDILDGHRGTPQEVLAAFSESKENVGNLAVTIDAGFSFKLFI